MENIRVTGQNLVFLVLLDFLSNFVKTRRRRVKKLIIQIIEKRINFIIKNIPFLHIYLIQQIFEFFERLFDSISLKLR